MEKLGMEHQVCLALPLLECTERTFLYYLPLRRGKLWYHIQSKAGENSPPYGAYWQLSGLNAIEALHRACVFLTRLLAPTGLFYLWR